MNDFVNKLKIALAVIITNAISAFLVGLIISLALLIIGSALIFTIILLIFGVVAYLWLLGALLVPILDFVGAKH